VSVGFNDRPTRHLTAHFRDESFQAIFDCTGTDKQTQGDKTLRTP